MVVGWQPGHFNLLNYQLTGNQKEVNMEPQHKAEAGASQLHRAAERQIDPEVKDDLNRAAALYQKGKFDEARAILNAHNYEAP